MKIKKTYQSKLTSLLLVALALVLTLPAVMLAGRVNPVAADPVGNEVGFDSVSPYAIELDGEVHTVTVSGYGFQEGVKVYLDGIEMESTFNRPDELSVDVPTAGIAEAGDATMTITNPDATGIQVLHALTYVVPEDPIDPGTGGELNPVVASVEFTQQEGKQLMIIHGTDFIAGEFDALSDAMDHSLVTLNGESLGFCADGFGMDAATLVSVYQTDPSLVTDDPNCYRLADVTGAGGPIVFVTPTHAEVWLRSDFNIAAQGTVSVNGSAPYTFNTQPTPGDTTPPVIPVVPTIPVIQPTTPSVIKMTTPTQSAAIITQQNVSDSAKDTTLDASTLERTIDVDGQSLLNKPVIDRLPTFKGKAQPYSTVVVTVHSDPVTCKATADANGDWKCRLSQALPAGSHTVEFAILTTNNVMSHFGPYSVQVAKAASTQNDTTPESSLRDEQKSRLSPWMIISAAAFVAILGLITASVLRRRKS